MENNAVKKVPGVSGTSRRGNGLTSGNADGGNKFIRCCNRLGCSAKLELREINHIGHERKGKSSVTSVSVGSAEEVENSAGTSKTTLNKRFPTRLTAKKQNAVSGTIAKQSVALNTSSDTPGSADLPGSSTSSEKRGLKNFRCATLSDVLPSGRAPLNSASRTDFSKGRAAFSKGREGSSSAKSTVSLAPKASTSSQNPNSSSTSKLEINQGRVVSSRNHENKSNGGRVYKATGSSSLVRNRNTIRNPTRSSQLLEQETETSALPQPVVSSQTPKRELVINEPVSSSSSNSNVDALPSNPTAHMGQSMGQSRYSVEMTSRRLSGQHEASRVRAFRGMAINAHEFRLADGIAGVLFALERMERDDELTYEQLLALEASLFLGGIGSYDYHREMRLDIDNMSYEELLALGDRMGTVSTALSEEALVQCLARSFYEPASLISGDGNDETKCSICQEEYSSREEVGKLRCDHKYHLDCIQQWLRIKNWCPVCKVPASSAPPA